MGLMDTIMGMFGKKTPQSGNSILDSVLPMLMKGGALGGLGGLIGKFTSNPALAEKAKSWISTGPNQPLEPHEVTAALGTDTVAQIAQQAGVSTEQAQSGLATMLPNLINHLTPGGTVPAGGIGKLLKGVDFSKILGGVGG
jgi:uncharacterized protein YidB (DUF937 family)